MADLVHPSSAIAAAAPDLPGGRFAGMTSSRTRSSAGVLVSAGGAAIAVGSLWLPWYLIRLPEAVRDLLRGLGGGVRSQAGPADQLGQAFAGLFQGLAAAMPTEISGSGWQVMSGGDVVLALAGGAGLLTALAMSGALAGVRIERSAAGRLLGLLGAVVIGVAAYHIVVKPGGELPGFEAAVSVRFGIHVALLGGALMLAGGAMTAARPPAAVSSLPGVEPGPGAVAVEGVFGGTGGNAPERPDGRYAGGSVAPPGWAPPAGP